MPSASSTTSTTSGGCIRERQSLTLFSLKHSLTQNLLVRLALLSSPLLILVPQPGRSIAAKTSNHLYPSTDAARIVPDRVWGFQTWLIIRCPVRLR